MNHPSDNAPRLDRAMNMAASFALALLLAALPWELYQRVPVGDTLVKIAGAVLIALWILSAIAARKNPFAVSGFAVPILAFACIAALTLLWSEAPGLSRFHLRVYATYALLFYAVVWAVAHSAGGRISLAMFVTSAAAVGAVTVACYMDVLKPTAWMTAYWPRQPLIEEWRDGLPMRIVAAGNDFNQTSMFLVAAVAALAFLFFPLKNRKLSWPLFIIALGLLLFSVMLTMSRSAFLICGVIVFTMAFTRVPTLRGRAILAVVAMIALVAVAVLQRDFFAVLWDRALGGVARDDGSVRNRMEVYQAGLGLALKYFFTGAGIGASEAAMRIHYPEIAAIGQKVHSVPLLVLIETGIVGLIAYLALWWQSFRSAVRIEDRPMRDAALAILFTLFAVLLVQPFQIQSAIPILIGIAVGNSLSAQPALPKFGYRFSSAAAVSVVAIVVALNVVSYQRHFVDVVRYGDAFAQGIVQHLNAHWQDAATTYAEAAEIARATDLARHPYWPTAARVYDLDRVVAPLGLGIEAAHPMAIAAWGSGHTALLTGNTVDADRLFKIAVAADTRFGGALFDLAEMQWAQGEYTAAAKNYAAVPPPDELEGAFKDRAGYLADLAASFEEGPSHLPLFDHMVVHRMNGDWARARTMASLIAEETGRQDLVAPYLAVEFP